MTADLVRAEWPEARLVIVDDEEPVRRVLQRMLEASGYLDVRAFADAAEALEVYRALKPDLTLLDLHLPGMDGTGCCRAWASSHPSSAHRWS